MHIRHEKIIATQYVKNQNESDNEKKVWREDVLEVQADRRAYERFPAKIDARLFFGNLIYTGKITDLSQSGMFVSTRVGFPVNSEFLMVVLVNDRTIKIPVKVRRKVKNENGYSSGNNGIGVELVDSPQQYMDFIDNYKSVI